MTGSAVSLRCPTELDTIALGERIGRVLLRGDLIVLTGPLGAGKTVLVRGVAVGAGADAMAVRSPTFVLHHVYAGRRITVHHVDLYRLGSGTDVRFLDIDGLLETGAVVVEWGELADLDRLTPLHILFEIEGSARVVTLDDASVPRITAAWAPDPLPA